MSKYSSRYSRKDGNRPSKEQHEKDKRLHIAKKRRQKAWRKLLGVY